MSTTLTIPDLDEAVEQKLRFQAAIHGRSLEEEARDILTCGVQRANLPAPLTREEMGKRLEALSGIWHGRGTTAEMMRELRGEE
jgi:plasmid stability protein